MNQTDIDKRILELQEQYPAMFSHPELKDGEIWIGYQPFDVASFYVAAYQSIGLSARYSKQPTMLPFRMMVKYDDDGWKEETLTIDHRAIFAELRKYVELDLRDGEARQEQLESDHDQCGSYGDTPED